MRENELRQYLLIGNIPPSLQRSSRNYLALSGYAEFGFTLEEAMGLSEFALEKNLNLEIFLGQCNRARKILQNPRLDSNYPYLIGRGDEEVIPALGEIEEAYEHGVWALYSSFIVGQNLEGIQNAAPHFLQAKTALENLTDPRILAPWKKTTQTFLGFMMSESALVFTKPTFYMECYRLFAIPG